MSFETLKASIYALMDEIQRQPEDLHALQERLREDLAGLKALGQPLPRDLVALEEWLEAELERPGTTPPPPAAARVATAQTRGTSPGRRHPPPHSERG